MSHKKHQSIGHGCTQIPYSVLAYAIPLPNIPFTGNPFFDHILIAGIVGGVTFMITKAITSNDKK